VNKDRRTVLRLLGNRSEAEDVAQEVTLRVWRGIGRLRGRSLFLNLALPDRDQRGKPLTGEEFPQANERLHRC
jgi:Sigma-70 region 2